MNIGLLLKIAFERKAWPIATLLIAALAASWMLINAEPVYVSGAKLWVRQRMESSELLRTQRTGAQSDTHINVQAQVIQSNRVMDGALDRADHLLQHTPSRSIRSKLRPPPPPTEAPVRLKCLKALARSVNVSIVNPEVLIVSAQMNDPKLAQSAVQAVIDEYQEASLQLALDEIKRHAEYLDKQGKEREADIATQQAELLAFEQRHPELGKTPIQDLSITSPTFAEQTTDVGAVPLITRQLAEMELKRNNLSATLAPGSYELRQLEAEIRQGQALLQNYLNALAEQGRMQVQHESMRWQLEQKRKAYASLVEEVQRLDLSRGSRIAEQSGITVLDPPSFDPEHIHPKKKATLMAAMVLGLIGGAGLGLLAHLLDPTVRYREALEASTGAPVLAVIPRKSWLKRHLGRRRAKPKLGEATG